MSLTAKIAPLLKLEDFTGREGTMWLVDTTPKSLQIRLERVIPGLTRVSDARFPFTLSFSTPWEAMLLDAMYLLKPVDGGETIEIHLIQSHTPPGPKRFYHAVFN